MVIKLEMIEVGIYENNIYGTGGYVSNKLIYRDNGGP